MVNVGKYTSPMDGIGMMKGKEMTGRRQGTGTLGYLTYATVDGQNLLVSHYLKRYRYALLITGAPGFCTATQRCGWQVAHSPALHILTICLKVPVSKRVLITFDYCRRTVRACINYLDLFETTQLYLKALQDRVPFNQIKYGIKKTWWFLVPTAFPDFKQSAFSSPRTFSTSLQRPSPPLGDLGHWVHVLSSTQKVPTTFQGLPSICFGDGNSLNTPTKYSNYFETIVGHGDRLDD